MVNVSLAKMLCEQKDLYNILSTFSSKIEDVTYIFRRVILENNDFIIEINLEDYETYASVVLKRKKDKRTYYALADYSYLSNATEMFDLLKNIDKDQYYQEVKECLKQKNSKEERLVSLIYRLLEIFLLEIA